MLMIGTIFRFIICITASFCCMALVRFRLRRLLALAYPRVIAGDPLSKNHAEGWRQSARAGNNALSVREKD